jgi:hypothetical protein
MANIESSRSGVPPHKIEINFSSLKPETVSSLPEKSKKNLPLTKKLRGAAAQFILTGTLLAGIGLPIFQVASAATRETDSKRNPTELVAVGYVDDKGNEVVYTELYLKGVLAGEGEVHVVNPEGKGWSHCEGGFCPPWHEQDFTIAASINSSTEVIKRLEEVRKQIPNSPAAKTIGTGNQAALNEADDILKRLKSFAESEMDEIRKEFRKANFARHAGKLLGIWTVIGELIFATEANAGAEIPESEPSWDIGSRFVEKKPDGWIWYNDTWEPAWGKGWQKAFVPPGHLSPDNSIWMLGQWEPSWSVAPGSSGVIAQWPAQLTPEQEAQLLSGPNTLPFIGPVSQDMDQYLQEVYGSRPWTFAQVSEAEANTHGVEFNLIWQSQHLTSHNFEQLKQDGWTALEIKDATARAIGNGFDTNDWTFNPLTASVADYLRKNIGPGPWVAMEVETAEAALDTNVVVEVTPEIVFENGFWVRDGDGNWLTWGNLTPKQIEAFERLGSPAMRKVNGTEQYIPVNPDGSVSNFQDVAGWFVQSDFGRITLDLPPLDSSLAGPSLIGYKSDGQWIDISYDPIQWGETWIFGTSIDGVKYNVIVEPISINPLP